MFHVARDTNAAGVLGRSILSHRPLASVLSALVLAACGGPTPFEVSENISSGLQQRVWLSDSEPSEGDTLVVQSVILNPLGDGVNISFWENCLEFPDTTRARRLEPTFQLGNCTVAVRTLQPGDSVRSDASALVLGPPGAHNLQIRHLVNPPWTVTVQLRISSR